MSLLRVLEPLRPLRDPVFIASFASPFGGGSGAATVEYLVEEWGADPVAEIDPDACFDYTVRRPVVHTVDGERVVEWPLNRLYVARPAGADRDFILMPGIEPHMRWRGIVDAIADALETTGCRTALLLGARRGAVPHTRPTPVRLTGTPSAGLARQFGLEPAVSNYEGPVGMNTVVAAGLGLAGLDVATVSAMTPVYVAAEPNASAVLALVRAIDGAFGTSTPTDRVEEARAQLDAATAEAVASTPVLQATVAQLEQQYDWIRGGPMPKAEGPTQEAADLPSGPELVEALEQFLRGGGRDGLAAAS